jgi:cytochrome b subunit of formate dehydrogenase
MRKITPNTFFIPAALSAILLLTLTVSARAALTNQECLNCHQDPSLTGSDGQSVFVSPSLFGKSVHAALSCQDCHSQPANFENVPHFKIYRQVDCAACHGKEGKSFAGSIHGKALASGNSKAPHCYGCHGANADPHRIAPMRAHAVKDSCSRCHSGYGEMFVGTVHESPMQQGTMDCLSCHRLHQVADRQELKTFGCGSCHKAEVNEYRTSVHRLARLPGKQVAATCADCHTAHQVLSPADPECLVNRENIPDTCGRCHGDKTVVTADYVKLPISLPSYTISVHGKETGKGLAAVCTDCHGVHSLQSAGRPTSSTNRRNLASTCGKCHPKPAENYSDSIHGHAVALGIKDSPSCTDCHDEHLILDVNDPNAPTNPLNLAVSTCGRCHQNPAMAARYGLPTEVVKSYEDSYHGWAIKRGGKAVAVCIDCHTTHDIRSPMDPASSVSKGNVAKTCGRCHKDSSPEFAASYTHLLARNRMMVQDWVRLVYIWVIALVLGGMFIHNLIIFIHSLKKVRKKHLEEPAYERMTRGEILQHILLAVSFIGLAITGFALRFPDTWWVDLLSAAGMTEEKRRLAHRILATALVLASFYHIWYVLFSRRGKKMLVAMIPGRLDFAELRDNMSYYLGRKKERPRFGMFDYTQKAEYWALIWGTMVMAVTGLVLWFPTLATGWLPVWVIRVCETVHFYEAILAVSAIVIWHFFFVIFIPEEYPMDLTWLTGRMSKQKWQENHPRAAQEMGEEPKEV